MSKPIEIGQSHNIISVLANNVAWSELDAELLQREVIENPRLAGQHFTGFLKNGGRMPDIVVPRVAATPAAQEVKLILPEPTLTVLSGVVLPDKSVSLAKRIKVGEYLGGVNEYITKDRFSITLEAGPADLVTAHFGVDMEDTAVDAWMKAHLEYQDALIEELLAVGAHPQHRELQMKFPIIARGSSTVVRGRVPVPYLGYWHGRRHLSLDYRDSRWHARCRFLLRKVSKPSVA